jgi:hypothetical protein
MLNKDHTGDEEQGEETKWGKLPKGAGEQTHGAYGNIKKNEGFIIRRHPGCNINGW